MPSPELAQAQRLLAIAVEEEIPHSTRWLLRRIQALLEAHGERNT